MTENEISVVGAGDVEWTEVTHGDSFEFRGKRLGEAADGEKLGCSLYELPPGTRSWPYHYHEANEEAMYVLEGDGLLRTNACQRSLSKGDYVALRAGEEGAHQVINDGDSTLRYLCFSTMSRPDAVVYSDSDKIRAMTQEFEKSFPADADVGYWEGEE